METVIAAHMRPRWVLCLCVSLVIVRLVARSPAVEAVTIDPVRSLFVTDRAVLDSDTGILLIPSDFVVHSFRPPMEEAMSRLWSQLG
jgi:hypothetical protein